MKTVFFLSLVSLIPLGSYAGRFEPGNFPTFFKNLAGTEMITRFDSLPLKGEQLDRRYGWSESYWPSNKGGIAYRWNSANPQPFKVRFHSKSEIQTMSFKELETLSPAELYDIAMGDYNYTLTKSTLGKYSTRDLWWEGICHGWAQAASNYPEPAKVIVTNPDGLKVPFGSSDVKALLAMHEAYNFGGKYAFTGRRCKVNGKVEGEGDDRDRHPNPPAPELANSPDCADTNAGAFHVVITNMLGIHGRGFVADIDRFNDVWNQPITHYQSQIIGEESIRSEDAAAGVARRVRIAMKMTYGEELKFFTPELAAEGHRNFVSKNPVTGTVHQKFLSKNYEYIVEVNSNGQVIGGEWISETRPDFLWMYERSKNFRNSPVALGGLGRIYRPVSR